MEIENALEQVNDILRDAAGVRLIIRVCRKAKRRLSKKLNKPWFTDKLVTIRKYLKKAGFDLVNNCRDDTLRQRFFQVKAFFQVKEKIQIRG